MKWTDSKGITHYEDFHTEEPPSDKELVTRFPDIRDYFSLHVDFDQGLVLRGFKKALENKAFSTYEEFSKLLGKKLLQRSKLNLRIYGDKKKFVAKREHFLPKHMRDVPGFYSPDVNQVVILHRGNERETLSIATHEIVHVINYQVFGNLPRWLNEGLAINITNSLGNPSNGSKNDSAKNSGGAALISLVSLPDLLTTGQQDWASSRRSVYYQLSGIMVNFLLLPANREFTTQMLNWLAENKCQKINLLNYIDSHFSGGLDELSSQFTATLK